MAVVRAFNSLKSFERLKSSGVSEEQARIFVDIFEQVTTNSVEHLASKEDLENSTATLKQDIRNTETVLRKDMALMESKLENKISDVRTELKQDIAELKQDNAVIKAEMRLLKSLVIGVFGAVVVNIIISLMHIH